MGKNNPLCGCISINQLGDHIQLRVLGLHLSLDPVPPAPSHPNPIPLPGPAGALAAPKCCDGTSPQPRILALLQS